MNQQVTFLSDGDEKSRELQFALNQTQIFTGLVSHHHAADSDESNGKRT